MLTSTPSPGWNASAPPPVINRLRGLRELIAHVGKRTHPRLYRHIHPHDHATSKLARNFAEYCIEHHGAEVMTADEVEVGALFHDVGKYAILETIVLKPARLDEVERHAMEHHSVISNRIMSSSGITGSANILASVLHHHEHWDGSGYPDGIAGTRIPLAARILAVCDIFISLREEREYKKSLTVAEAFAVMDTHMAGREMDPHLYEVFRNYYFNYYRLARKRYAHLLPPTAS